MALAPRQRRFVLWGALIVTLGLVAWMSREPEAPAEKAEPTAAAPSRPAGERTQNPGAKSESPASVANLKAGRANPGGERREVRDLFARQSWYVPPPEQEEVRAPEAPELPFTYLGQMIDRGQVTLYLANQDRNLSVRQGDVIDGTYKVKRITPSAVTFVYLPMNKQQTLEIGRTN